MAHLPGMQVRILRIGGGGRSRAATVVLAVVALVAGGIFFLLGLALLATLIVAGTIIGGGWMIARKVRGRRAVPRPKAGLDPSLEVYPPDDEPPRLDERASR